MYGPDGRHDPYNHAVPNRWSVYHIISDLGFLRLRLLTLTLTLTFVLNLLSYKYLACGI